ncbi:hypothetical protein G3O08_00605 [Cryomorpha ignava]|uniref:Beta-carotene 15,15'-monooxygenase n=1 Tax=Cryomorpha ignava TaxID=101383 RepID=A0A7K3WK27_9FLAO|nr:DUF6427 family protein [Cryomorpha ignava]NEN22003.1 hypothetical protein [Cryomorpha ignava]
MIHSAFGSNRPMVFGVLLIPAIIYGVLALNHAQMPVHVLGGPLFDLLITFVRLPYLSVILGLIVNLIGAFLVNLLYNTHDYSVRENYFPAFFYFLLASLQLSWIYLNPVLIGNVFVLLALRRILRMYRVQEITSMIYDASFFLALGALFFPLLIFVFPLLWIGLIQLRTFNFREWIVPIIGLLTPVVFTLVFFWWQDYTLDVSEYMAFNGLPLGEIFADHGFWYLPILILSLLILFIGLITFLKDMSTSTVHKKNTKKVFVTVSILMLAVCIYGLSLTSVQAGMFATLAIPVSVFASVYFSRTRRKKLVIFLFYVWVLLLFFYPILATLI